MKINKEPKYRNRRCWMVEREEWDGAMRECVRCGSSKDLMYPGSFANATISCRTCKVVFLPTDFGQRSYASMVEARRSEWLRGEQDAERIEHLEEQVSVVIPYLNERGKWRADSRYEEIGVEPDGDEGNRQVVYEDAKGFETRDFSILKRLWCGVPGHRAYGPGVLRVVKWSGAGWDTEDFRPDARAKQISTFAEAGEVARGIEA